MKHERIYPESETNPGKAVVRVYIGPPQYSQGVHVIMKIVGAVRRVQAAMMNLGIIEVDFMPSLPRGSYKPSPGVDYEMFLTFRSLENASRFDAAVALRQVIFDMTGLVGKASTPLTQVERADAIKEHKLTMVFPIAAGDFPVQ